jgi:hypothetical protein
MGARHIASHHRRHAQIRAPLQLLRRQHALDFSEQIIRWRLLGLSLTGEARTTLTGEDWKNGGGHFIVAGYEGTLRAPDGFLANNRLTVPQRAADNSNYGSGVTS